MTDLTETLRADLTAALRQRDRDAVRVLRTTLAAIANAEAQPADTVAAPAGDGPIAGAASGLGAAEVDRRELTAADVADIVAGQRAERLEAVARIVAAGGDAAALRAEAAVLDRYLTDD